MEPPDLSVVLLNRQRRRSVDTGRIRRVLRGAARALRVRGELAVVLGGDGAIRRLNARYRGKDEATDVLSFPGPGGEEGLGDVVISVATAERNARAARRSLRRELDVLAIHGLLHCLGYDHETDDGTMERIEGRLRRRLLGRP
jgi:probable rRNA maturation factor